MCLSLKQCSMVLCVVTGTSAKAPQRNELPDAGLPFKHGCGKDPARFVPARFALHELRYSSYCWPACLALLVALPSQATGEAPNCQQDQARSGDNTVRHPNIEQKPVVTCPRCCVYAAAFGDADGSLVPALDGVVQYVDTSSRKAQHDQRRTDDAQRVRARNIASARRVHAVDTTCATEMLHRPFT